MRHTSTEAAVPGEIRAEVRALEQVMRYGRTGTGPSVVLLGSPADPEALWPGLREALAGRFRVILPELPRGDGDIAAWLAAFLEGLGSTEVRLVASSEFCFAAMELALGDLDRLARIVLVPSGDSFASGVDEGLATLTRQGAVPMLVIRRGSPSHEAIPRVVGFCADGAGGNGEAPY